MTDIDYSFDSPPHLAMPCYAFDLDGTLADLTHRLPLIQNKPKDWPEFFRRCVDDKPIHHVVQLARCLQQTIPCIYVSGRSSAVHDQTLTWLEAQGLDVAEGKLYMRAEGDYRADDIIKLELLAQIREDGWKPLMVFDDRDRVVKMWRANGIPCAQVAEGQF